MKMPEPVRSIPDDVPARNRTLGRSILKWTAEYLQQPDGPRAGARWRFTPEQARIVLRWYEIDAEGRFVHRRGVIRRMKGSGKTPFLASLAAAELCGPCRFGGWDAEGMPVVIQHPAPWVQVAAVNLAQTRNTMLLLPAMFSKSALSEYDIDLGKEIVYARGTGQIQAVTSSPKSLEGNRATLVIADESHLWLSNNQGAEMMEVIKRNLAKAREGEARVMEITNAHLPGEESAAEETYEAWRKGKLRDLYYDALEAPPIADLHDLDAVREGLLAARGDSHWLDVDRLLAEIADPTTPEWISRRYYLNQVVAVAAERWMDMEAWDSCAREDQEIPDGAQVVLGFDGSRTGDATALVAVSVVPTGEIPHVQPVAVHENTTGDPAFEVDMAEVMEEIRQACKRWRVREITADLTYWQLPLRILSDEGLPVVEMPQTLPRMAPATAAFHQAAVSAHLTHSGDPDLRRHVANACVVVSTRGDKLAKDSKSSPRKIDLAVAALMAFHRAAAHKPTYPECVSFTRQEVEEWDAEEMVT
jgi:phage terminase large subunit-like protein